MSQSFNRGDIVLVDFPFSDLTGSKVRPAIIISNSLVNKTDDVICAQITSNIHRDDFSFELRDSDVTTSLRGSSEVRCHKLFTADKTVIRRRISHLHATKHDELYNKIISLLKTP